MHGPPTKSRRWPPLDSLPAGRMRLVPVDAWRQESLREQKIQAIREENGHIEDSIHELGPDGREVEKLARQELGLAKPGQTVIKIPDKK
jgi:cell division protein FtsB